MGINLALGAATGVYMPDFGSGRGGGGGWSPGSSRDGGLVSRVFDRVMDSPVGSAVVITAGVGGAIVGLALAGGTLESMHRDHLAASRAPMHVAVLDAGTARADYGYPNVSVEAMHGSKGGAKGVHAAADSTPGRGALAVDAMLGEMRRFTRDPIVVHAYDPFVKGPDGKARLDLEGIREIAPLMAKDGVKVAVTPFAVPATAEGRELSRIMASNGIAVFSATADKGVQLAPGTITVKSAQDANAQRAHFAFEGNAVEGVGRLAATGVIKVELGMGSISGSRAVAHAIQSDMREGVLLVDRSHRRAHSIPAVDARPDVPVADAAVRVASKGPEASRGAASSMGKGPSAAASPVVPTPSKGASR